MLMVNYLQRSLFKWRYAILIISIISAMVVTFSFQIDRWLPDYTKAFSNVIDQQFQAKIFFRTAHYRFPNHLIFKDVRIFSTDQKNLMLRSSRLVLGFSFPLFSSSSSLDDVVITGLHIDYPVLKDYVARHGKKIHAWIKTLPKGKIHVLMPDGQFQLKDSSQELPIPFKTDLRIDHGYLSVQGSWGYPDKYNYTLYGNILDSGFDLGKLTLEGAQSSVNLWGSWHANSIDWKGFIFYDKTYILDIDGHLKIQKKDIVLKQLSFSIDKDNVNASGYCLKQSLFQCDAQVTFQRGTQHLNAQEPLKNIDLHLHAQNTAQGIAFKGAADLYFLFDKDSPTSLQSMHLNFEDLTARIINAHFLKLKIKKIQSTFLVHDNEYSAPLEDLWGSIDFARPFQKTIALSANIFGGHCDSRAFLDTSSLPWRIIDHGEFERIDINRLSDNFPSFKQSYGLLSGTFNLRSSQNIKLAGTLKVHNGNFNDPSFLVWLARTLQMPSLKHLSGADLSCHFRINGQSKILDDLKLNSDAVNLKGFFHIDADDLVSSQVSVGFSKKLLSESPVGRDIIGLVHGAWTLPFNFSLSGNLYRMNFQWDNSTLKDKVRQHMFSFVERMIDQRMDAHPNYNVTIPNGSLSP